MIVGSATTYLTIDSRTCVRECLVDGEQLCYDIRWYDGAESISIVDNGVVIGSGTVGYLLWQPNSCGCHSLQLKALANDGLEVGAESSEFVSHVEVVTTAEKAATCTEEGRTKGSYCSRCDAILSVPETIPALGHQEAVTTAAKAATCTEGGCSKGSYCSRCDAPLSVSETFPELGHQEVVTTPARTATCAESGCTKGSYCGRCGVVLATSDTLDPLGHDWCYTVVEPTTDKIGWIEPGKCNRCGLARPFEMLPIVGRGREMLRDLGYDDLPDDKQSTLEYDSNGFMIWNEWVLLCEHTEAVGVAVPAGSVGIGRGAFADMHDLTSIEFPSSLIYIASEAFANDYCLDNVVIPDSVDFIGDGAFSNCTEIASISFGGGLKHVGDAAFYNCISLESVVFQEGVTNLGARAFYGPSRLKSVSLPVSLNYIGDDAFKGSAHITGVTVPTHLKTMKELFPDSYQQIESVVVPEGEGIIMDSMFAGCTKLKTIIIPASVTNIGASAFANCESLVEFGLPDEVTTLGTRAFYGCSELRTVSLSRKLTAIEDETFGGCPLLSSLVIPASVSRIGSKIYSGGIAYSMEQQAGWISYQYKYETRNDVYGKWYYGNLASLTGLYFLGNAPETQSDTYEGMPDALTSYVVKGSTGWYLAGAPTLPPDGWPMSGNSRSITYWTPNEFEVTFDGNGGSPETYVAKQITDTTYSLPKTNPTRSGYLFDGWWTEKSAGAQVYWNSRVTATKAQTLYAHWKALADTVTVTFNPNGGTVNPTEAAYSAGVTYGELPVPTRIGHTFLGWHTSQVGGDLVTEASEVSKEDDELYAHWTPITYTIVFKANGGLGTVDSQTHTYNVAQALTANAFYLNGFKFVGWSTTAGGAVQYADKAVVENLAEVQDQVVTLYAVWNGATYAVRFDGNGGVGIMDNQTHTVGARLALSACGFTRKGYAFLGWATTADGVVEYGEGEEVQNLTMASGAAVSLFAVWSPIQYAIAYDANGGDGSMTATTGIYDKEVSLASNQFSKTGCAFAGWAETPDGDVVYGDGENVLNLADSPGAIVRLYAVWEEALVAPPVIAPKDGTVFSDSCQVTISCATEGASIYYRVGAKPTKATSKFLYSAPFEISETSVIYAFAKSGDFQSEMVSATLTKEEVVTFLEAAGATGITWFVHGGNEEWTVEKGDVAHSGGWCVRSGGIGDSQESWFEAEVEGPGTISFYWKASCEEDELKEFDHLEFLIDGDEQTRIDGETDWLNVAIDIGSGAHTLRWAYVKDDGYSGCDDCCWIDDIVWSPNTTPTDPIPDLGENPTMEAITNVFVEAKAEDPKLAERITSKTKYRAFREWSGQVQPHGGGDAVGAAGVMAAPNAWISYALGSETLIEIAPTDADLTVETFEPKSGENGKFDFTVGVEGVDVGGAATTEAQKEALKENLKLVFGVEGSTSLDTNGFSSDNVDINFDTPENGKVKFTAGPNAKNADAKMFFMKVKVAP